MALTLTPQLVAAIEGLYEAFKGYPLPETTSPCPCCHSVDSEGPLYSRPLRKLRPEDLEEYARQALLVWGGVNEFRHFLPRIFEIVVSADIFWLTDREIVFSKLDEGEWREWPQAEQQSVQSFLLTLWRIVLEDPPCEDLSSTPEIESWLCTMAQTGGDISFLLDAWVESLKSSPSAGWNLAALIYRTGMPQSPPRGINAFWEFHMDQAQQVSDWLHSETVRDALQQAIDVYAHQPFAEELLAAWSVVA